jgi:hypothetical protein
MRAKHTFGEEAHRSMTRIDHIRRVLDEFQASYPTTEALVIETVWHWTWTVQETRAFNRRTGWKKATGIYLFIDFCTIDDIHTGSTDERFSVVRRIGKAEYSFADRINDYGHRVSGVPGARLTWYWGNGDWQEWFRYSQIDIVQINVGLAATLETYMLSQVATQCNDRDVPPNLWGNPIIYDADPQCADPTQT